MRRYRAIGVVQSLRSHCPNRREPILSAPPAPSRLRQHLVVSPQPTVRELQQHQQKHCRVPRRLFPGERSRLYDSRQIIPSH